MDFVEANGVALRCELSGAGDRALVLVHEMGGSLESWDEIAPRFARSRRVLRYDTRGAGLSQKVRGELTFDTMAGDIKALLDHYGIAGRVAKTVIVPSGWTRSMRLWLRTVTSQLPSGAAARFSGKVPGGHSAIVVTGTGS